MRLQMPSKRSFFLVGLFAALLLSSCQSAEAPTTGCPQIPPGLAVSEAELSYLALLRAHHHAADIQEQLGNTNAASLEMKEALSAPRPKGAPSEEAYLDVAGRAATLLLKQDKPEEALPIIEKAAKEATHDSFYLGALKMAEGEVYMALAKKKRATNDTAGAEAEDRKALDAYEASQEINGRVLDQLQKRSQGGKDVQ